MRHRRASYALIALGVLAVWSLLLVSTPAAQNAAPPAKPPAKPTPRALDGHVDLTGFWVQGIPGIPNYRTETLREASNLKKNPDGSFLFLYGGIPQESAANAPAAAPPSRTSPVYKPEFAAKAKAIADTFYGNATSLDPQYDCKPLGVPRAGVGIDEHLQIVQSPQVIAFMWEADPGPIYRVVYMDGRPHPKDVETSYMGHSVGHWEGDTLVVDVVGLNDETWLGGGNQGPKTATLHSDQEHVIERWTRVGDDLTYEATVEDPVMFAQPWVMTPQHTRLATPDDYIRPQMCVPNDKEHLIRPSEKDQFKCNYCNPDNVYAPE